MPAFAPVESPPELELEPPVSDPGSIAFVVDALLVVEAEVIDAAEDSMVDSVDDSLDDAVDVAVGSLLLLLLPVTWAQSSNRSLLAAAGT